MQHRSWPAPARATRRRGAARAILLAVLMAPAGALLAHPDLLLQIESLDRQIAEDPGNAELLARRGDLYRRHQDYARAAEDFEAARAADPADARIDFLEARLMLETRRPEQARALLSPYLETRPGHAAAWLLRGKAHIGMGLAEPAADDFAMAISTSGRPGPEPFAMRVLALAAQGEDRAGAALEAVDAGLERFPFELRLRGLGVDIALGSDRVEDAQVYLRRLPPELRPLPQWQARLELADCLDKAAPPARSDCLRNAREELAGQVGRFLADP